MAYHTYEQLVDIIDSGKTIYFVDDKCDITEFSFDGQYKMVTYNITKAMGSKTLTDEEFGERFTYYLRHYKGGIKKNEQ